MHDTLTSLQWTFAPGDLASDFGGTRSTVEMGGPVARRPVAPAAATA